ncbi:hypothetical protein M8818_003661 [Zalaria obscura]|uniref:Uncharacterized protein n=1 Tax=Zalaria obscura TaxID=2024903 RepID=A0ACC3SEF6_9PEZI
MVRLGRQARCEPYSRKPLAHSVEDVPSLPQPRVVVYQIIVKWETKYTTEKPVFVLGPNSVVLGLRVDKLGSNGASKCAVAGSSAQLLISAAGKGLQVSYGTAAQRHEYQSSMPAFEQFSRVFFSICRVLMSV